MIIRALLTGIAIAGIGAAQAHAAERMMFEQGAFESRLAAGDPILVHVTAPWCGECRAQKPIVATLAESAEYKRLVIFDVDFDTQKDALRQLRVQKQSTLVVFKEKAEVGRAVGITRKGAIDALIRKAL